MGFKTQLDIGRFGRRAKSGGFVSRPLTAAEVDAAIVGSGGRLLADGHEIEPQITTIAALMTRHGRQDVRGFLGREPVVRHPDGYVRLSLEGRSAALVAAFVRLMVGEFGCDVYRWDDEEEDPSRIIAWLDRLAEQHRIDQPGSPDPNRGLRN